MLGSTGSGGQLPDPGWLWQASVRQRTLRLEVDSASERVGTCGCNQSQRLILRIVLFNICKSYYSEVVSNQNSARQVSMLNISHEFIAEWD